MAYFVFPLSLFNVCKPYPEEVFEVGLVVGFALQQGSGVELAGTEADVRLHVRELRSQQVPDQLNRHVLPFRLFTDTQRSGNQG